MQGGIGEKKSPMSKPGVGAVKLAPTTRCEVNRSLDGDTTRALFGWLRICIAAPSSLVFCLVLYFCFGVVGVGCFYVVVGRK